MGVRDYGERCVSCGRGGSVRFYGERCVRCEERPYEEEPFYMPEEEDDYIGDARGGYSVSHAGRYIGTYETLSRATAALYLARCADSYWPNVWYVNDHGNVTLCVFDGHSLTFTDTAYV